MPEYRAYIVGTDGHIKCAEVIVADDDEEAVQAAQHFVDGHDVEVGHLDRKIVVLPHKD